MYISALMSVVSRGRLRTTSTSGPTWADKLDGFSRSISKVKGTASGSGVGGAGAAVGGGACGAGSAGCAASIDVLETSRAVCSCACACSSVSALSDLRVRAAGLAVQHDQVLVVLEDQQICVCQIPQN